MTDPASALPDYDVLAAELRAAGVEPSPAEAHGVLTGLLCAPGEVAAHLWREHVLGEAPATAAVEEALSQLLARTHAMLEDTEFGFEPLLPSDDEALEVQLGGFTDWCQGFLIGFSAAAARARPLSTEAKEFLADLVHMSESEMEAEGGDDEGEARALAELTEYLRAGVQVLYDERSAGRLH